MLGEVMGVSRSVSSLHAMSMSALVRSGTGARSRGSSGSPGEFEGEEGAARVILVRVRLLILSGAARAGSGSRCDDASSPLVGASRSTVARVLRGSADLCSDWTIAIDFCLVIVWTVLAREGR